MPQPIPVIAVKVTCANGENMPRSDENRLKMSGFSGGNFPSVIKNIFDCRKTERDDTGENYPVENVVKIFAKKYQQIKRDPKPFEPSSKIGAETTAEKTSPKPAPKINPNTEPKRVLITNETITATSAPHANAKARSHGGSGS